MPAADREDRGERALPRGEPVPSRPRGWPARRVLVLQALPRLRPRHPLNAGLEPVTTPPAAEDWWGVPQLNKRFVRRADGTTVKLGNPRYRWWRHAGWLPSGNLRELL